MSEVRFCVRTMSEKSPGASQILFHEISRSDWLALDQLVIRGRNNDDLIPRYRRAGKLLAVNGCFHKAKFRLPVLNGFCYLGRVANVRSYLDLRVGSPKRR